MPKQKIILKGRSVNKVNWLKIVARNHTPLWISLCVDGVERKYFQKSLGLNFGFHNFKKIGLPLFMDQEEIGAFTELTIREKGKGLEFFKKYIDKCYKQCSILLSSSKKTSKRKKLGKLNNLQLLNSFEKYRKEVMGLMPFLPTWRPIQAIFEKSVKSSLKEILVKQNEANLVNYYFNKLFIPPRNIYLVKNLRNLLAICAEIQRSPEVLSLFEGKLNKIEKRLPKINKKIYSKILENIRKFGWIKIPYYYGDSPASFSDIIVQLKNLLRENCSEKLSQSIKREKEAKKKYQKTIKELNISQKLVREIEILDEYLYLINYRLDVFSIADYYARNLLNEIAGRLGISYQDLVFLTYQEISQFLRDDKKLNIEKISKRKQGFGFIKIGRKSKWYFNGKFQGLLRKEKEIHDAFKELKGERASPGKVKGLAKIILGPSDIKKVQRGNILVTTMTTPNLITAMQKSKGIVTDEGGILCHAAIISRELGIPCVINTKIATQILKDGDLVEVDANKGIVRKL